MSELFGCTIDNIELYLKNIDKEKELNKDATTEKIAVVQKDGNKGHFKN